MKTQIPTRDLIHLSAYLDGQLAPRTASRMMQRLDQEPDLQAALAELQRTRSLLRAAPRLRASRNFTLTPAMVGKPVQSAKRFTNAYRLASALASLLLVLVVAGDFLSTDRMRTADQAMPSMAEVVQPEAAVEMEAPASKSLEAAPAGEAETYALQTEPTVEVALEMEAGAADRAEKSEPPQEPAPDETVVEELAVAEAEAAPQPPPEEPLAEEAPLMLAAPAAEEQTAGVEGDSGDIGETVAQPGEGELEAALQSEAQNATGAGADMAARQAQEPESQVQQAREISGADWPWLRVTEAALALVALGFGLLAWFSRTRR